MKSPEFCMVRGISADENARLQAMANALERRMFKRRIKYPAKTLAEVRLALRGAGWVRISAGWDGGNTLVVKAKIGARRKAELGGHRVLSAESCLFSDFVGAARQAGLKPGIEDISVQMERQKVAAIVNAVPFADTSAVLNRMVERWRKQHPAKAGRAKTKS
jgi:hypothetical protein